ncbi:hypothetical protein [Clostridium sp.]|uniref:hypothetical protein n=1 Tax=Clostridium sp. TaxID=1506 RepID=UPI002FCC9D4D
MYDGLDKKILRGQWVKNRYKDPKQLATKIFKDCFFEILLDIINNNITFVLPLRYGAYAEISMEQFSGDKFKRLYKIGKFMNIDYILSQFTGNELVYRYNTRTVGTKEKNIHVDGEFKKLIDKFTHEAREYY